MIKKWKLSSKVLSCLTLLFAAGPQLAFAQLNLDPPPPVPEWEFNDRCVPYRLTDEAFLANGIDPALILDTFAGDPDSENAPWTADYEEDGLTPIPCDEFHTNQRRTRYEGCHFYDGTPCFFTTNGQLDPNAFTDTPEGRRAFDIAEHFVIYEVVQNYRPANAGNHPDGGFPPPNTNLFATAPFFADPFCCGFAVGTQTKIMNAANTYWQDNPSGVWKIGFIQFVQKAYDCGPPALPDPNTQTDDCVFLNQMRVTNGLNSQGGPFTDEHGNPLTQPGDDLGMPLIFTGDEIFELTERHLVTLRYRTGGSSGVPGGTEGPRYILCPVHENPANGTNDPNQSIVQGFPTHIEYQPPCGFSPIADVSDPNDLGHIRQCEEQPPPDPCGGEGEQPCNPGSPYPFGPTAPPGSPVVLSDPPIAPNGYGELNVYQQFDCLQRTGSWCL
jgi:hypothetical protein